MTVVNNGQTISMTTFVKHNEISVHYTAGNISRSFEFEAVPGGNIHIYVRHLRLSQTSIFTPLYRADSCRRLTMPEVYSDYVQVFSFYWYN